MMQDGRRYIPRRNASVTQRNIKGRGRAQLTLAAQALVESWPTHNVARNPACGNLNEAAGEGFMQAPGQDRGVGVRASAPGVVPRREGVAEAEDAERGF